MKTILFARHAKSNWNQQDISDFERPLNDRGFADAPVMASYLQQCGYGLHKIISSDAVRALQTADVYKEHLTPDNAVLEQHELYLASHLDIAQVASEISAEYSTVMIVGHNPGMADIVNYFSQEVIDDMPTCSVAIIQFDIDNWCDLTIGSGHLLGFEYPKKIIS